LDNGAIDYSKLDMIKDRSINDLLYKTIYNDKVFKLPMSQKSYYEFRDAVINELTNIEHDLEDDFNGYLENAISKASLKKKFRFKLHPQKIKKAKKEAMEEVYKIINKACKESDKDIVEQRFYEDAEELLKKFNSQQYEKLINRFHLYLNNEYDKYKKDYILEEIQYINNAKTIEEKNDVLIWIFENTSARSDAFDSIKLDAENIYLQCVELYNKDFYKKTRAKMNAEEKRLYQLMYFRRDIFLGKIPALDGFLRSFWQNNMRLIIEGLVVKNGNPFYTEKHNQLEQKWREFLQLYPIALSNASLINKVSDKIKCKKIAKENFKGKECNILIAFLDNHDPDTICANYDITNSECEALIQKFQEAVRNSERKDIAYIE
jgi:RNA polymerase-interacting CarD/CdnL/TRCF family regulator